MDLTASKMTMRAGKGSGDGEVDVHLVGMEHAKEQIEDERSRGGEKRCQTKI